MFLELFAAGPIKRPIKRVSLVPMSIIANMNGLFAKKVGVVLPIRGTTVNSAIK